MDPVNAWGNTPLKAVNPNIHDLIDFCAKNPTSFPVPKALASALTNKYSEGMPGNRYYGGNEFIDENENENRSRAPQTNRLDRTQWGVNVQPYSGSPANFAASMLQPHDPVNAWGNTPLEAVGPDIPDLIDFSATEDLASFAVTNAGGSALTNKYSEGVPGNRYYGGIEFIDENENENRSRAPQTNRLDRTQWGVNVQPYSGSPANFAASMLQPHDPVNAWGNTPLKAVGPDIPDLIDFGATEDLASFAVTNAGSGALTNKYSEGVPGNRYYGGIEFIDENENRSGAPQTNRLDRTQWGVNEQPYSGSPANFAAYNAVLQQHDPIMGSDLPSGGHFTHGQPQKKTSMLKKVFKKLGKFLCGLVGRAAADATADAIVDNIC